MMTRGHRQEALSRAYVRAVAAQVGLTVSEPENDYGIDMTLRAITLRDRAASGPVLREILPPSGESLTANGPALPAQAEPAPR